MPTKEIERRLPGHLIAVFIEQGGAVTKVDGAGAKLLRGEKLDALLLSLPRANTGSAIHTLYVLRPCDGKGERYYFDSTTSSPATGLRYYRTGVTDDPLLTEFKALWTEG